MDLKKITFNNFRQFYGSQELSISSDSKKNITLIHAENGVGKTTILNAILWCFYEETTARFEKPDKIANNQAVSEGDYSVKVEVFFTQDGEDYLVVREKNEQAREKIFQAFRIDDGNFKQLDNPTVFVNSVIPQEMAKYFFFDGEYAEAFSSQKNKSKVRDALEDMLGCRTANVAIKDLEKIKKTLESKVAALTRSNDAAQFQQLIDKDEEEVSTNNKQLSNWEVNLKAAEEAKEELQKMLRGAAATGAIQEKREEHEATLKRHYVAKLKKEAELTAWIYSEGIGTLTNRLNQEIDGVLKEAKVEGKIPSYIAETFVQDLLERRECICKRPFEQNSDESRSIEDLMEDAGSALATDRLLDSRVLMGKLSEKREKAVSNYTRIKKEIENIMREISSCESIIGECTTRLKGCEVKEMAEKQEALDRREAEIKTLEGNISITTFKNTDLVKKIEVNKGKRAKLLMNNNEAVILQKQITLINETIKIIVEELKRYREESREKIASDVNEILKKTARRDYYATIDEKFDIEMRYSDSKAAVARSSGENQLLSFAFIGALLKFSSERMQSESEVLKPGTSAPLVLDSPFGQLDPSYQKATATFLPDMAGQVVLLLSKAQANTDVMKILEDRVGNEYVLVSENISSQGNKPKDSIVINGEAVESSLYGCEKDRTRIHQVSNQ